MDIEVYLKFKRKPIKYEISDNTKPCVVDQIFENKYGLKYKFHKILKG